MRAVNYKVINSKKTHFRPTKNKKTKNLMANISIEDFKIKSRSKNNSHVPHKLTPPTKIENLNKDYG
jgi:hypothetical protein